MISKIILKKFIDLIKFIFFLTLIFEGFEEENRCRFANNFSRILIQSKFWFGLREN